MTFCRRLCLLCRLCCRLFLYYKVTLLFAECVYDTPMSHCSSIKHFYRLFRGNKQTRKDLPRKKERNKQRNKETKRERDTETQRDTERAKFPEPFPSSPNQILGDASSNLRLQIISRKPYFFGSRDQLESCRSYEVLHLCTISA